MEQVFPPSGSLDSGKDVEDGMDMETTIRRDRYDIRCTLEEVLLIVANLQKYGTPHRITDGYQYQLPACN